MSDNVDAGLTRLEERVESETDPRKRAALGLRLALYWAMNKSKADYGALIEEVIDDILIAASQAASGEFVEKGP